jgi:hypothetical protein
MNGLTARTEFHQEQREERKKGDWVTVRNKKQETHDSLECWSPGGKEGLDHGDGRESLDRHVKLSDEDKMMLPRPRITGDDWLWSRMWLDRMRAESLESDSAKCGG